MSPFPFLIFIDLVISLNFIYLFCMWELFWYVGLFGWWENVSVESGLNWIILTFPFDAMEWLSKFSPLLFFPFWLQSLI